MEPKKFWKPSQIFPVGSHISENPPLITFVAICCYLLYHQSFVLSCKLYEERAVFILISLLLLASPRLLAYAKSSENIVEERHRKGEKKGVMCWVSRACFRQRCWPLVHWLPSTGPAFILFQTSPPFSTLPSPMSLQLMGPALYSQTK